MTRLRHSASALLRTFQISQKHIFLIIEGRDFDSYVYGRIAMSACGTDVEFQVMSAAELPGKTGGKRRVLLFYRYLRRLGSLVLSLGSRRRAVLFYLDKDVDDFLKTRIQSPHVCYTPKYDLESHIISEGNLADAIAAAIWVEPQVVKSRLGDIEAWRAGLAAKWIEWTAICLYVRLRNLRAPNYGALSQVNAPPNGSLDRPAFNAFLGRLQALSGLSQADFTTDFARVRRIVGSCYRNGHYDIVFKGKWYFPLMDLELRKVFLGTGANLQHLPARIGAALVANADYSRSWADIFRQPLRHVIPLVH